MMGITGAQHFLTLDDRALRDQCSVDHYRASGPGGQKRNKTSSAVRLRHHPTGLSATASDDRSQHVNLVRALRRLREAIALHARGAFDPGTYRPSETLVSCLQDGNIRISRRDPRYYCVLAEVLDVLAGCEARVSDAARALAISTGHLIKFLEADPKAWQRVNELRAEAGQKPLR